MIKCENCCYFFSNTDDHGKPIEAPHCQYRWDDGYAPCEVDDNDNETEDIYED